MAWPLYRRPIFDRLKISLFRGWLYFSYYSVLASLKIGDIMKMMHCMEIWLYGYLTINLFYGTGNVLTDAIKWIQKAHKYIAEKFFDFL